MCSCLVYHKFIVFYAMRLNYVQCLWVFSWLPLLLPFEPTFPLIFTIIVVVFTTFCSQFTAFFETMHLVLWLFTLLSFYLSGCHLPLRCALCWGQFIASFRTVSNHKFLRSHLVQWENDCERNAQHTEHPKKNLFASHFASLKLGIACFDVKCTAC